jgi:hypothetical protein
MIKPEQPSILAFLGITGRERDDGTVEFLASGATPIAVEVEGVSAGA